MVNVNFSSGIRILLCGLRKNVDKMRPKIKTLLKEVQEALDVTKHCVWFWEKKPLTGSFEALPGRVTAILEKERKV